MYCENCGAEIGENDTYCHNCGVNIGHCDNEKKKSMDLNALSGFGEEWKTWSTKKKALSFLAFCCVGWIIAGSLMAVIIPDADVSDDSYVDDSYADDLSSDVSESVDVAPVSSDDESESFTEYDSSTSSDTDYIAESFDTSSSGSYIGNSNTKKFHTSYCSHADRIKDSNKVFFSSRDDAIASGYVPCKVCNP